MVRLEGSSSRNNGLTQIRFNSYMVRLEEEEAEKAEIKYLFQFLYGAIGRLQLKSNPTWIANCFNSYMVRLEVR